MKVSSEHTVDPLKITFRDSRMSFKKSFKKIEAVLDLGKR